MVQHNRSLHGPAQREPAWGVFHLDGWPEQLISVLPIYMNIGGLRGGQKLISISFFAEKNCSQTF